MQMYHICFISIGGHKAACSAAPKGCMMGRGTEAGGKGFGAGKS